MKKISDIFESKKNKKERLDKQFEIFKQHEKEIISNGEKCIEESYPEERECMEVMAANEREIEKINANLQILYNDIDKIEEQVQENQDYDVKASTIPDKILENERLLLFYKGNREAAKYRLFQTRSIRCQAIINVCLARTMNGEFEDPDDVAALYGYSLKKLKEEKDEVSKLKDDIKLELLPEDLLKIIVKDTQEGDV